MWDEYYPNGSFSVPFTILAFHEQDLVCQAFQSDEEDWMNGGEQQSPRSPPPSILRIENRSWPDLRNSATSCECWKRLGELWRFCQVVTYWRSKNEIRRSFRRGRSGALKAAILLYGGAKRIAFASVHEPYRDPAGGAPYLDAGRPITTEFLRALARGLGMGMAPEILPSRS